MKKLIFNLQGMGTGEKCDVTFDSVDAPASTGPKDIFAINLADNNIENLHAKTPSGLPQHKLRVKVGGIYMIIKNLDVEGGLCNGTRVQVRWFSS